MNATQTLKENYVKSAAKRFFDEEHLTLLVSLVDLSDMVLVQVLLPRTKTQNAAVYIQEQLAIQGYIMHIVGHYNVDLSAINIATSKTALCITFSF